MIAGRGLHGSDEGSFQDAIVYYNTHGLLQSDPKMLLNISGFVAYTVIVRGASIF